MKNFNKKIGVMRITKGVLLGWLLGLFALGAVCQAVSADEVTVSHVSEELYVECKAGSEKTIDDRNLLLFSTHVYCAQMLKQDIIPYFFFVFEDREVYNSFANALHCEYRELTPESRKNLSYAEETALFQRCVGSSDEYLPHAFMEQLAAKELQAIAEKEAALQKVLSAINALNNEQIKKALRRFVLSQHEPNSNIYTDVPELLSGIGIKYP